MASNEGRPRSPAGTRPERLFKGCYAPLRRRFWAKLEVNDGCWLWRGGRKPSGYGNFAVRRGHTVQAHRFAYELLRGPIPAGMELDHVKTRGCTSTACVNPAHLEPVSRTENIDRARRPTCVRGHPYDERNTVWRGNHRRCRVCLEEERQTKRARAREEREKMSRLHKPEHLIRKPRRDYIDEHGRRWLAFECPSESRANYNHKYRVTEDGALAVCSCPRGQYGLTCTLTDTAAEIARQGLVAEGPPAESAGDLLSYHLDPPPAGAGGAALDAAQADLDDEADRWDAELRRIRHDEGLRALYGPS
jgi:hypothetical protein